LKKVFTNKSNIFSAYFKICFTVNPHKIIEQCFLLYIQYTYRNQDLEKDVEFVQNVIKSIRSMRSDYNLTTKNKADGK